jgi:hypothetical protein
LSSKARPIQWVAVVKCIVDTEKERNRVESRRRDDQRETSLVGNRVRHGVGE